MNKTNPKHDRQGVRQAKDLEQKYDFSLLGKGGNNLDGAELSRLNQLLSEYMVKTNVSIAGLKDGKVDKDYIFNYVPSPDTLVWDGNIEGLQVFDMLGDGTYMYYPISDIVPSIADFANGATLEITVGNDTETVTLNDFVDVHDVIVSQSVSSVLFVLEDNTSFYGSVIPKKGVYSMYSDEYGYVSRITIPEYTGFDTELQILKKQFIPEEYVTDEELDKKISAIPEGSPTEALTEEEIKEICVPIATEDGLLPVASKNELGCVKIGDGLEVTEDGTVSIEETGEIYQQLNPTNLIRENTDLNDYLDVGSYICQSSTVAQTLSNTPYTVGGFILNVSREAGSLTGAYRRQTIETGAGSGRTFVRTYDANNGYNGWNEFVLTPVDSKHKTVLWSGSWSSGTITVPNTANYSLFKITMSGQGTAILGIKHGNFIRGVGGYSSATPSILTYHFGATLSGNTWTFVACNSIQHNASGSHNAISSIAVTGIEGII